MIGLSMQSVGGESYVLWYFGCHYPRISGSSEGTTCVCVSEKSDSSCCCSQ